MPSADKNLKLVLFALCAVTFMLGFELGGFQLALMRATNELGIGGAAIGLPVAAQFVSVGVMPLIFGPISDRAGKKKILLIFMAVFAAGSILTWSSGSSAGFLFSVFILGTGYGVADCVSVAISSDVFSGHEEKYINFIQSFFCAGAIVSPIILQNLMDHFAASWRVIFLICAIAVLAVIPAVLLSKIVSAPKVSSVPRVEAPKRLPLPLLLGFLISIFIYVGIESCIASFADTVFAVHLGAQAYGAYAIALFWAAMGVGRFIFGRMKEIPGGATAVCLFCLTAVIAAIAFCGYDILALALFAASGFACSCVWPGIVNAAIALDREASGKIMGYLNLGGGMGGSIFPLAIGAIMNTIGVSVAFLILAAFSVFAGIYLWKKSRHVV